MKFLSLIFKNAFRKKTRTLLTIGSIVLPLLVICLMGTFLKALEAPDPRASRGSFRLVVRHRVSIMSTLPTAFEERVRQLPGVAAVSDFTFFSGQYRDKSARNFFARAAVDPETLLKVFDDAEIVEGSARDWRVDRTGCIVGKNLAAKYGWKVGDRVVLVGDVFPTTLELTIRGVYYLENGTSATSSSTAGSWTSGSRRSRARPPRSGSRRRTPLPRSASDPRSTRCSKTLLTRRKRRRRTRSGTAWYRCSGT